MGTLYIVATPIGNLKDITLRALETLKSADLILAEDTRVIQKLLFHYEINRPVKRYDEYSRAGIYEEVREKLKKGGNVALVADAGTPGIADPGSKIVGYIKSELPGVQVTPLPGASAITAALSASGIRAEKFTFLGYPPHKKGREKFFRSLQGIKIRPVVIYESPHRIDKTLNSLSQIFGPDYEIIVGREITKIHEEIWSGSLSNAQEYFVSEHKKGEFVLIVP